MKALTVKVALPPERLAKICREHGNTSGDLRFGVRVCPFAGASCPIDSSDKACRNATAEDWEKVLQDEEPEPRFRFGDKVTVTLCDGKKRKVFCHTVGGDGIAYFYEGSPHTLFARWEDIREGWA